MSEASHEDDPLEEPDAARREGCGPG